MKRLESADEVMLVRGLTENRTFNPYYGLVVRDLGPSMSGEDWTVLVLWEDGIERRHQREDLLAWADSPVPLHR